MDHLQRIKELCDPLDELVEVAAEARSPEVRDTLLDDELGEMLVRLDSAVRVLKAAKSHVEAALGVVLSAEDPLPIPGLDASIEKRIGAPRKNWDHNTLKTVVIESILESHRDPETGAIEAPYTQLMAEVLDYGAVSYWRAKKLKELGINAGDYCETGDAKTTFQISRQTQERYIEDDIDFFD